MKRLIALLLVLVVLAVSLLTLVASYTKSFREAQTWLSFVLLPPLVPVIISAVQPIKPTVVTRFTLGTGHHVSIESGAHSAPHRLVEPPAMDLVEVAIARDSQAALLFHLCIDR